VLVSLVVLFSRGGYDLALVVQTIREVQLDAGKHIKKVCKIIGIVADLSVAARSSTSYSNSYLARSWPRVDRAP